MKQYEMQAKIIAAAGHPLRLAMLEFLQDSEQCVCDIADYLGAQRSNVSRHLSVLQQAGLVDSRKEGLKMMYKLKTPCILLFLGCITSILKEQAEEHRKIFAESSE